MDSQNRRVALTEELIQARRLAGHTAMSGQHLRMFQAYVECLEGQITALGNEKGSIDLGGRPSGQVA
jgi:hypothetical protein